MDTFKPHENYPKKHMSGEKINMKHVSKPPGTARVVCDFRVTS